MDRELLEKPFEPSQIKQRKGTYGNMLDYVDTRTIIQRLNEAFDGNWSFEIMTQETTNTEVIVSGKLTADGISKSQFGSNKISISKQGEVISIGDDLKAATSDCLKKTATLFGVGLHLYGIDKSDSDQPSDKNTSQNTGKGDMSEMSGNKGNGNGITKDQLALIKKLRTQLKWTVKDVEDKSERMFATRDVAKLNSVMATAFIAFLQNQGNNGNNGDESSQY
jgi:hypothetical protein